jgi:hypothetical protein
MTFQYKVVLDTLDAPCYYAVRNGETTMNSCRIKVNYVEYYCPA